MSSGSQSPLDGDRGPAINAIAWVGFSVSAIFTGLRLFTRIQVQHSPAWDDWVIVFSMILNLALCSLSSAAVSHGLGRHLAKVSPEDQFLTLEYAAILQPIGIASYCVPKLAVVILLNRLMGTRKRGQWFLYGLIVILFIGSALSAIFVFAQCNPPSHFWRPTEPASCMSPFVLQYITLFAGSWSAFTDLGLALFPVTIFWNLKMPLKRKILISGVMGIGTVAMVCAIIKTINLPEAQNPDFTWAVYDLLIWTCIETDIVIVCACVPILPRLISHLRGKDGSSSAVKQQANFRIGPLVWQQVTTETRCFQIAAQSLHSNSGTGSYNS